MKKLILAMIVALFFGVGLLAQPTKVLAGPFDAARDTACEGLEFNEGDSTTCDNSDGEKVNNTVANVINIASLVVGVIAVIMIVVGGLKYVTSQGDSGGISSAKNTIMYAVIGVIIVILAQVIVRFVINRASDSSSSSSSVNEPACSVGQPC